MNFSKLQLEILNVYYLWTRAWQIVCMVYHKYANLFLCCQKILKPTHLCMPFSPLHITLCQLSVLGFPCFLRNVLNLETENPLHYLASNYVLHVFHLEVDVGLCEHIRYSSLWQSLMLEVTLNNLHL